MLVFRAEINKMLVRKANKEDPDQTASSEAVSSGSALFVEAFLARNYCQIIRTFTIYQFLLCNNTIEK